MARSRAGPYTPKSGPNAGKVYKSQYAYRVAEQNYLEKRKLEPKNRKRIIDVIPPPIGARWQVGEGGTPPDPPPPPAKPLTRVAVLAVFRQVAGRFASSKEVQLAWYADQYTQGAQVYRWASQLATPQLVAGWCRQVLDDPSPILRDIEGANMLVILASRHGGNPKPQDPSHTYAFALRRAL